MLKYLGFGLTVAGGLALMLLRPAAALSASAQLLLGGVVIVLGLWIFRPFSLPLSALTPSITVRVAIVAPIAASCCELCGLAPRSRGSALVQLTAFVMAMLPGGGWLSGTLTGAVLQGAYEMTLGLAGVLDFSSWLRAALLTTELAAVFTLALALLFLRPKEPLDPGVAAALRAAAPGPLTRRELCAAAVLTAAFVMFATGGLHGIPSAAVCLGAAVLPAVREVFGIDPLVFVPILSLAAISFVLAYQNIWALRHRAPPDGRSGRQSSSPLTASATSPPPSPPCSPASPSGSTGAGSDKTARFSGFFRKK